MSSLNTVRMGVIGVGALGRHHARILANMDGVDLIAVADPNEEQARQVAEAHQTDWVTDYKEIIDQCEAFTLVAPTCVHHQIAMECLQQNRDLLVEKPLTSDVAQALELAETAIENSRILQVGHIERFNPAFETLCESLTSPPRYVRAERVSPFPFRSLDIGVIHDLMIHDIELILHLAGRMPTSVEAWGTQLMGAHEDTVQCRLHFDNGMVADLLASRVVPEPKRSISVWTTTETIDCDLHTRTLRTMRPTSDLLDGPSMEQRMRAGEDVAELRSRVFTEFIDVEETQGSDADALTAELSEFVSAVRNRTAPRVTAQAGLQAVQVAEQVLLAMQSNYCNARRDQKTAEKAA